MMNFINVTDTDMINELIDGRAFAVDNVPNTVRDFYIFANMFNRVGRFDKRRLRMYVIPKENSDRVILAVKRQDLKFPDIVDYKNRCSNVVKPLTQIIN
jgi:hypothetical protein